MKISETHLEDIVSSISEEEVNRIKILNKKFQAQISGIVIEPKGKSQKWTF